MKSFIKKRGMVKRASLGKAPSNLPSQLTDGEAGPKRPVPLLAENGTLPFDVCEDVFQRVREGAQIFFRDVEGREKAQDDFVGQVAR